MKKVVLLFISFIIFSPNSKALEFAKDDIIDVKFVSCIDGDTANFEYNGKELKTRLLAVDTPETKHPTIGEEPFGKEASNYTCDAISNAKKITLEFDSNSDLLDKYERYLAWVFVDNNLLQSDLIEKGLAKVAYLYGDYKYTDDLKDLENIAKKEQVGIWGDYVEAKDYTLYYIGGGIILLIILGLIISKTKNKTLKNVARKSNTQVKKEITKLFKKL